MGCDVVGCREVMPESAYKDTQVGYLFLTWQIMDAIDGAGIASTMLLHRVIYESGNFAVGQEHVFFDQLVRITALFFVYADGAHLFIKSKFDLLCFKFDCAGLELFFL